MNLALNGRLYINLRWLLIAVVVFPTLYLLSQDDLLVQTSFSQTRKTQVTHSNKVSDISKWLALTLSDNRTSSSRQAAVDVHVYNYIQSVFNSTDVAQLLKVMHLDGVTTPPPKTTRAPFTGLPLAFRPIISDEGKISLYDAAVTLSRLLDKYNVTYFMHGGTLLGSYRHHDIIPWYMHWDFMTDISQKYVVMETCVKMQPEITFVQTKHIIKIYPSGSQNNTGSIEWKWPNIKIHFFAENKTHIWDTSEENDYRKMHIFDKSTVFPLHKRPMGIYYFNAPKDSYMVLRNIYQYPRYLQCESYTNNNVETPRVVDCASLSRVYPFVHRSAAGWGVRETLKFGDHMLHSMLVNEPQYAVTHPHRLVLVNETS